MFTSRFMPCSLCGESVERTETQDHRCDSERLLDYAMFGLREEIAAFETRFQTHLDTPTGQFQTWLASREVRGPEG